MSRSLVNLHRARSLARQYAEAGHVDDIKIHPTTVVGARLSMDPGFCVSYRDVDFGQRYSVVAPRFPQGSINGVLLTMDGDDRVSLMMIGGRHRSDTGPDHVYLIPNRGLPHHGRPPMIGIVRAFQVHVHSGVIPAAPVRPTLRQRELLATVRWSLFTRHGDCPYGGTVAGPDYAVEACPACGHTGVERLTSTTPWRAGDADDAMAELRRDLVILV